MSKYNLSVKKIKCSICGKKFRKSQLGGHLYYCRAKQNGIKLNHGKYFDGHRGWAKGLTKHTNDGLKSMAKTMSKNMKERFAKNGKSEPLLAWMNDPIKVKLAAEKQSKTRKERYASGKIKPMSNCRGKCGWYKNIWCDSSWELAWVIYNLDHNISFTRNNKRYLYTFNNEQHCYTPDFELANGSLIEIKGYIRYDTSAKISSVTDKKLIVLTKKEMQPILKYVRDKYGKDFIYLLENHKPLVKSKKQPFVINQRIKVKQLEKT